MKIVFFGDSITDAGRDRLVDQTNKSYGSGYVFFTSGELMTKKPNEYEIYNRGIGGDRIVDLYGRIKRDVWNLQPDLISIFVGVNDVWHQVEYDNGVDIERFERIYRMLIEDTMFRLPNVKIILIEPYVLKGERTEEKYDRFLEVYEYAKVVKNLAEEYGLYFLPLQEKLNEQAQIHGTEFITKDGVHPVITGAKVISNEWLKFFYENIDGEE